MSSPDEKAAGKYNVSFGGPTTIGHSHIGDVNTNNYNPVSNMTITIDNRYIQAMPAEYRNSLEQFVEKINDEMNKENIPPSKGAPFQNAVNQLAEATTKLKEGGSESEKKKTIRDRLKSVAVELAKLSPGIARIALGFSPLAPFSNLIGDTFESMVRNAM